MIDMSLAVHIAQNGKLTLRDRDGIVMMLHWLLCLVFIKLLKRLWFIILFLMNFDGAQRYARVRFRFINDINQVMSLVQPNLSSILPSWMSRSYFLILKVCSPAFNSSLIYISCCSPLYSMFLTEPIITAVPAEKHSNNSPFLFLSITSVMVILLSLMM